MRPDDFRRELFTALEQGRFDQVISLAIAYRESLKHCLDGLSAVDSPVLDDLLQPLKEALRFLRVLRAHQSQSFRNLTGPANYPALSPDLRDGPSV